MRKYMNMKMKNYLIIIASQTCLSFVSCNKNEDKTADDGDVMRLVHIAVGHPGGMDVWQSQSQPSACLTAIVTKLAEVDSLPSVKVQSIISDVDGYVL